MRLETRVVDDSRSTEVESRVELISLDCRGLRLPDSRRFFFDSRSIEPSIKARCFLLDHWFFNSQRLRWKSLLFYRLLSNRSLCHLCHLFLCSLSFIELFLSILGTGLNIKLSHSLVLLLCRRIIVLELPAVFLRKRQ